MVLKDSSKIMLGSQEVKRIYLGSQKVYENFPAGYRKVDWIQGSGTQYIIPNVLFNNNYRYEYECECANVDRNQMVGLDFIYTHGVFIWQNNYFCKCSRYDNDTDSHIPYSERVTITVDCPTKSINIKNDNYDFTHTYGNFEPSSSIYPCLIMAANEDSTTVNPARYGMGRIYYFKWYENNVLIRDMQPCVRISDGVAGMLDLVNKVFYTNAGTGNFIVPS